MAKKRLRAGIERIVRDGGLFTMTYECKPYFLATIEGLGELYSLGGSLPIIYKTVKLNGMEIISVRDLAFAYNRIKEKRLKKIDLFHSEIIVSDCIFDAPIILEKRWNGLCQKVKYPILELNNKDRAEPIICSRFFSHNLPINTLEIKESQVGELCLVYPDLTPDVELFFLDQTLGYLDWQVYEEHCKFVMDDKSLAPELRRYFMYHDYMIVPEKDKLKRLTGLPEGTRWIRHPFSEILTKDFGKNRFTKYLFKDQAEELGYFLEEECIDCLQINNFSEKYTTQPYVMAIKITKREFFQDIGRRFINRFTLNFESSFDLRDNYTTIALLRGK